MFSHVCRMFALLGASLFSVGCGTPAARVPTPPQHVATDVPVQTSPLSIPARSLPGLCELAKGLDPLPAPSPASSAREVSPDNLRTAVHVLADPSLQGRAAGSLDNRRVARWIADRFASYGLPPAPGADHCVGFERRGIQDQNVVAHWQRNKLPNAPVVVIGAHYDAQGRRDGDIFPGADDNASGVAALLEIARISVIQSMGVDLVFIAFGAEEKGLLGAKAYVEAPSIPLSRVKLMINLDMVGRPMLDGSPLRLLVPRANEAIGYVIGDIEKSKTDDMLERAAQREDRPIFGIPEVVLTRLGFASDSVPFSPHVPTIFLSTGDHRDYHQPTDTPDKLDFEQIVRAVRLTLALIDEVTAEVTPKTISRPGNLEMQ